MWWLAACGTASLPVGTFEDRLALGEAHDGSRTDDTSSTLPTDDTGVEPWYADGVSADLKGGLVQQVWVDDVRGGNETIDALAFVQFMRLSDPGEPRTCTVSLAIGGVPPDATPWAGTSISWNYQGATIAEATGDCDGMRAVGSRAVDDLQTLMDELGVGFAFKPLASLDFETRAQWAQTVPGWYDRLDEMLVATLIMRGWQGTSRSAATDLGVVSGFAMDAETLEIDEGPDMAGIPLTLLGLTKPPDGYYAASGLYILVAP